MPEKNMRAVDIGLVTESTRSGHGAPRCFADARFG
jgi:hypothetical protein